jgi:hypothetical protein
MHLVGFIIRIRGMRLLTVVRGREHFLIKASLLSL